MSDDKEQDPDRTHHGPPGGEVTDRARSFERQGGNKYYEAVVPNFALNGGTTLGSSFVRLGSFPTTEDAPSGFANSVGLANLVGDAAFIKAVEGSPPNADQSPSGFSDGSGLEAPYDSAGDPNYFLGFADDTRQRGTDPAFLPRTLSNSQPVDNTTVNRQSETLRLLTKGGWWDHSDGNRVTTTSGDKIEVIQGNYKLVVLGRQPLPTAPNGDASATDIESAYSGLAGNAFITDVSGGHFQEQYPSPTPCIKTIEYSVDGTTGEWTLYQDNSIGNLITKLKGRTVDMFQGSSRETFVGSSSGSSPDATLDPSILSQTWAQKIVTYTGSSGKWVPTIENYTYATSIYSNTFAASVVSTTEAEGDVVSTTTAPVVVSATGGGLKVDVSTAPFNLEVVAGMKVSFQLAATLAFGLTRTSFYGKSTSIDMGKEVINASKSELDGLKTSISESAQNLSTTLYNMTASTMNLDNVRTNIAASMSSLADEVLIGV